MLDQLRTFLDSPKYSAGRIDNERALQLEIGMMFRQMAYGVRFEVSCRGLSAHPEHTKPQKRDLDLLVSNGAETLAIELKAPFAGRVPETMFDFYSDVAFVEGIVREGIADRGVCLMLTNDRRYWDGIEKAGIYQPLRVSGTVLHGLIHKPTGSKENAIFVRGSYRPTWQMLINQALLLHGRYTLLEINHDGINGEP